MKILVTGASGLVGSQTVDLLKAQGHQVVCLVRSNPNENQILWNPSSGEMDLNRLENFDAVVHLAGENIATGRWTDEKKAKILNSRVDGTKALCKALGALKTPPGVLVCASAIGYYGDRGAELLTEDSQGGFGFLASVCQQWEAATETAKLKHIRVVNLRIGAVLSPKGGALEKMLPPFQMGAGGILGSGKQYMSWISLDDLAGIIYHVLQHGELSGAVNAVAPNPVTNSEFTAALGAALNRPTIFPVPAFAIRLLVGEMADELLLSSARVQPKKLLDNNYMFSQPEIAPFLKQLLR